MNNIFNTEFMTMENPQTNWFFKVQFFISSTVDDIFATDSNLNPILVPLKIDLPKIEYKTVTQKFLGTEKSFPIGISKSGETTMEFLINKDNTLYDFFGMYQNNGPNELNYRKDTERYFEKIDIFALDTLGQVSKIYEIYNPLIISLEHENSFDYSGEDLLKISITIHYDDWDIK